MKNQSAYKPHQGEREKERRRIGGFHKARNKQVKRVEVVNGRWPSGLTHDDVIADAMVELHGGTREDWL